MHRDTNRQTMVRLTLSDGRYLHMRHWRGEGSPLVLLHGLLGSSASWRDFALASRRPCFAFDLPGFGHSSLPRRPRLSAYADDVAEGLRLVSVRSCTVVGHSLGGGVATALAECMGDDVASLVLCAPAGFGRLPHAELAALPGIRHIAVKAIPRLLTGPILGGPVCATLKAFGLSPTSELRRKLATDIARIGPGARAAVQALATSGRSPQAFHRRAVTYPGPVTVLWGDRDPIVPPSHIDGLLAALPQAGIHIWAGAGHYLHRDRPEDLAVVVESAPCAPRVSARSRNEELCFSAARVRQLTPRTSRNGAAMAHGAPRRGGELWTSPALGRAFPRRRSVDVRAVSRSRRRGINAPAVRSS